MHDPDCEGACFDYTRIPAVFGDRTGSGPMNVAWDTNVLIDYAKHGRAMAEGQFECPPGMREKYCDELEAIGSSCRSGNGATSGFTCAVWRSPTAAGHSLLPEPSYGSGRCARSRRTSSSGRSSKRRLSSDSE